LSAHDIDSEVLELTKTTATAQQAAEAVGCQVSQIVKSLVFMGKKSGKLFLLLVSGSNRVDTKKVSAVVAEAVKMAPPEHVHQKTGFGVGGVPPIGHLEKMETFVDDDLLQFDALWSAAGTSHTLFKLSAKELVKITKGRVIAVK
jgi:Cys-tRNA(Pro) deacylase